MSYVSENRQSSFTGMGAAVLVNGSIILAVALSPLVVEPREPGPITVGENIPNDPPPPPPTDKVTDAKPISPIFVPKPIFQTIKPPAEQVETTDREQDTGPIMDGKGGDDMAETVRDIIKPPIPPFKAATRDPNFARGFQPAYPVGMLQREIEGSATVRVLIGTDGRVRQVQLISATEPEFARATERQALKSWRFKPAMRGPDPVEDWQTLTVRFDING
jgi:periplasmic protein TonB